MVKYVEVQEKVEFKGHSKDPFYLLLSHSHNLKKKNPASTNVKFNNSEHKIMHSPRTRTQKCPGLRAVLWFVYCGNVCNEGRTVTTTSQSFLNKIWNLMLCLYYICFKLRIYSTENPNEYISLIDPLEQICIQLGIELWFLLSTISPSDLKMTIKGCQLSLFDTLSLNYCCRNLTLPLYEHEPLLMVPGNINFDIMHPVVFSVVTNGATTPPNKTIYLKIILTLSPATWLPWLGSKLLRNIWRKNVMGYLITIFVKFKVTVYPV